MTPAYLDHLSFELGDVRQTLAEAKAKGQLISDPAALAEAGFAEHCVSSTNSYELAHASVEKIADHLQTVDVIIYSTCLPHNASLPGQAEFDASGDVKHLMNFPASHLQTDFGMTGARVIGLTQQACTGMIGSIALAQDLITASAHNQRILCVTADRFPDGALYEQAYNLISDGAAACLVSTQPSGFRIVSHYHLTNGGMVKASDDETVGSFFSFAHQVVKEAIDRAELSIEDIDWIVPQNTNTKAWEILTRLLGIDMSRVFLKSMASAGHIISGDNIVNLKTLVDERLVEPGQRLLLFMAGYGSNWQAMVVERI
ncbi:MAG: 3-oxoacyl-[acyl-carrier-protein] synthase III C-terminal domain-containing protein [Gammaproteobacteria bacterium]